MVKHSVIVAVIVLMSAAPAAPPGAPIGMGETPAPWILWHWEDGQDMQSSTPRFGVEPPFAQAHMARKITRRQAVGLLTSVPLGAAAWPLASLMQAGDARRPNIIYIMSDDHASHALSCYGSRVNRTPNLDLYENDRLPIPETFDDDYATRARPAREQQMTIERDLNRTDLKQGPIRGTG